MSQFSNIQLLHLIYRRFTQKRAWETSGIFAQVMFACGLPFALTASELPYFEELSRAENILSIYFTHFKVTPDGCYVLVANTPPLRDPVIDVYQLQLSQGKISKRPVSFMRFDSQNNPFAYPTSVVCAGNESYYPLRIYVFSFSFMEDKIQPLISGYQLSADGMLSAMPRVYILLPGYNYHYFFTDILPALEWGGQKNMVLEGDTIFASSENGIAVIQVKPDGSLFLKYILALPKNGRIYGFPATLIYAVSAKKLFVGVNCFNSCKEKNFLLIYSINDYNNASLHTYYFTGNTSTPVVLTALSKGHEIKPRVVMYVGAVGLARLLVFNPYDMTVGMSPLTIRVADLEFSMDDHLVYVSSNATPAKGEEFSYGLVAFRVNSNLTSYIIESSGLKTDLNHHDLELTPDGCHLLATTVRYNSDPAGPGNLILYRINDPELNCTGTPAPISFTLIVGIPTAVIAVGGLTLVTFLVCHFLRRYGSKKGYSPIND